MRKTNNKSKRKEVIQQEVMSIPEKPKIGRPIIPVPEGEEILSNNLYNRQWEWIKKEARVTGQYGAQYLRWLIDMHIASIEASREDPKEIEQLFKSNHTKE